MHRVQRHSRVIDHKSGLGRVQHIGGISEPGGEIRAPHLDKAIVPFGHAGVQRRLRLDGNDHCARCRDRECRSRIAARTRAIKDHAVKAVEKAIVDQPVEKRINWRVAEPCIPF